MVALRTDTTGDHRPGRFTGLSIEAARRSLAADLKASGSESADLDARMLVGATLRLDLTGLIREASRLLTTDEAVHLESLMQRRIAGEPVARITGSREFWGLPFVLSADTLVPRPDTETVVERTLELVRRGFPHDAALRILDLGTGSGAILLALLSELPNSSGVGTDISAGALRTARSNATAFGMSGRASFINCSFAEAIGGIWDVVVSNPPYIRSDDIGQLAIEVRGHDPVRALDGGPDGLAAYRHIIPQAARLLRPGGFAVVEAGIGQADDIGNLMVRTGLTICGAPARDLAGIPRAVAARKAPR